jgi:hypothetical protein
MRLIFNRFQPHVNSFINVCYSTAILNLKEISSVDAEIRYIEIMHINMISPGIPLYIALIGNKDMITVAKPEESTRANQLTTSSEVHLEELVFSQLVKKLPAFYETRRLIIVFTAARSLSQFRTRTIQPKPCQTSYFNIYFNTILPFTPRSSKCSLYVGFPHQIHTCNSSLSHLRHMHVRRMGLVHIGSILFVTKHDFGHDPTAVLPTSHHQTNLIKTHCLSIREYKI